MYYIALTIMSWVGSYVTAYILAKISYPRKTFWGTGNLCRP